MTLRTLGTALFASSLALAHAPSAAHAQEDDRAQARTHFTAGVTHYERGDYRRALEEFQEAYRLAPHPTVRVNMANCYEHLGRPLEALHHFEGFLSEAENASPEQRAEVTEAVSRLEGQLGTVRLAIAPDGASVVIDNAETRRAPILEPVRLSAGIHHIIVRMDGYQTSNQEIEVVGGQASTVSVRLERGSDAPASVASNDPPPPARVARETSSPSDPARDESQDNGAQATGEPSGAPASGDGGGWQFRMTLPVIISMAATGAFLAVAVGTGVGALIANDDFEAAVVRVNNEPVLARQAMHRADGQAAADRANTLSIVSDVFTIATIAATGATIFFVVVEGMGSDEDSLAERGGPSIIAAPSFSSDGGGLTLMGAF